MNFDRLEGLMADLMKGHKELRESQKETDRQMQETISKFRKHLPKYAGLKAYLGIAGFSFSKKVLEEAEKQGICIIRQVGKSIEMSKYSLKAY